MFIYEKATRAETKKIDWKLGSNIQFRRSE